MIRLKVDGKDYSYGIGWQSEGVPEEELKKEPGLSFEGYCLKMLRRYQNNIKTGFGAHSPKEQRKLREEQDRQNAEEKARAEVENITFHQIFIKQYTMEALDGKSIKAANAEKSLFKKWIDPVIGKLPLKDIAPVPHIQQIKKNMTDSKKSLRSTQYALAVVRQVFVFAREHNNYTGTIPTSYKITKIKKFDNQRVAFLSHEQADLLLETLKTRSTTWYHISLLSLHTGARAGELFNLKWGNVNLDAGIITLLDTKNGKTRHCHTTKDVHAMLTERGPGMKDDYVFSSTRKRKNSDKKKGKITEVSHTFDDVVEQLKFNEGVKDRRQRIVFHSLRHTFASWLVQSGVSLYVVQKLLGHEQISQTQRYSHLNKGNIEDALKTFEAAWQQGTQEAAQVINFSK